MTTWATAKQYIENKYVVEELDANTLKIPLKDDSSGEIRVVVVSYYEAAKLRWLDFATAVCHVSEVDPEDLLALNNSYAYGGIAKVNDIYTFRYSLALHDMSSESFDYYLLGVFRSGFDTRGRLYNLEKARSLKL